MSYNYQDYVQIKFNNTFYFEHQTKKISLMPCQMLEIHIRIILQNIVLQPFNCFYVSAKKKITLKLIDQVRVIS